MKSLLFVLLLSFYSPVLFSQNVGIGTANPQEKLEVNGNIRSIGINSNTISTGSVWTGSLALFASGSAYDFLIKENDHLTVGYRKGHAALALRYIIAMGGTVPQATGTPVYNSAFAGEVKLFAGVIAPAGWMFCEGQLLAKTSYPDLFNVIGETYGGGGPAFALPDLRSTVPVGTGSKPQGLSWEQGESSN